MVDMAKILEKMLPYFEDVNKKRYVEAISYPPDLSKITIWFNDGECIVDKNGDVHGCNNEFSNYVRELKNLIDTGAVAVNNRGFREGIKIIYYSAMAENMYKSTGMTSPPYENLDETMKNSIENKAFEFVRKLYMPVESNASQIQINVDKKTLEWLMPSLKRHFGKDAEYASLAKDELLIKNIKQRLKKEFGKLGENEINRYYNQILNALHDNSFVFGGEANENVYK